MGSWRQLEQLEENELEVQLSEGLTDLYPREKSSSPSSVKKDKMKFHELNLFHALRTIDPAGRLRR